MKLATIGNRYVSYFVEQSFLIPISTLMTFFLGVKPVLLGFFLAYKLDFQGALNLIFTTSAGWINLVLLFLVSFLYYTFESATGFGIGSKVFGFQVVTKFEPPQARLMYIISLRNLVRSFFIINLANALFVLIFRRNMQTLVDHYLEVVVATDKDELKHSFKQSIICSSVMYYSTFLILLVLFALEFSRVPSPPTSSGTSSSYDPYKMFYTVLDNNLILDVTGYAFGGVTILLGTFIRLFSSNILETDIIASLNHSNGTTSFIRFILPQFFPETMGYVFGIAVAISLTDILLYFLQALIRNEKKDYFIARLKIQALHVGYYSIISVLLIGIGAVIESLLGIYNL